MRPAQEGERMSATVLVVVTVIVSIGAGFGAGWGLKPDKSEEVLKTQAEVLQEVGKLSASQKELIEAAGKPVVIDAELRATLAEIPAQCRKDLGGDPMSATCQWATCLQFGQSSAQRPECRAVEQLMLEKLK
jgi:hypothetical protein